MLIINRLKSVTLFILLSIFINPQILFAAEYFVSTSGNDSLDGLSTGNAWSHAPGMQSATGNAASTTLNPDDTVWFKMGENWRTQRLTLKFDGTSGHPITYSGKTDWGSGALPKIGQLYHHSSSGDADYNTVEYLDFYNDGTWTNDTYYHNNVYLVDDVTQKFEGFVFNKCISSNAPDAEPTSALEKGSRGLYVNVGIVGITITNSDFENNGGEAIYIANAQTTTNPGTFTIQGNRCVSNSATPGTDHQTTIVVGGAPLIYEDENYIYGGGYSALSVNPTDNGTGYVRRNYVDNTPGTLLRAVSAKAHDGVNIYSFGNIAYRLNKEAWQHTPREAPSTGKHHVFNNTAVRCLQEGVLFAGSDEINHHNNLYYWCGQYANEYTDTAIICLKEWYQAQIIGTNHPLDGLSSDNNLYYPDHVAPSPYHFVKLKEVNVVNDELMTEFFGDGRGTFAEWLAFTYGVTQYDQNSLNVDPQLNGDYTSKIFTLSASSQCIGGGSDRGDGSSYLLLLPDFDYTSVDSYGLPNMTINTGNPDTYEWPIGAVLPDTVATGISPANGSTDVSEDETVTWTNSGIATKSRVYFDKSTNPPTTLVQDTGSLETEYDPSGLDVSSTYYFRIDQYINGSWVNGTVYTFDTAAGPPATAADNIQGNYTTGGANMKYATGAMTIRR